MTPWTAGHQAPPSCTVSQSLLRFMFIESVMVSNHLIFCRPLHHVPSIFPSIQVFSNKLALCNRWPKYWRFNFSISPSNEYLGLNSFRLYLLVWSPCSPRDSQESSPAPQFKSIDFLALCILYDPTLTSIYIFWKNHSFEYTKLMAKWCLYYLIHCLGLP